MLQVIAKDGAVFNVEASADAQGVPLFVVSDGDGVSLGKIRFTDKTQSECEFRVVMLDRYVAEIVQYLRDRGY
jgi:hypothetical protein